MPSVDDVTASALGTGGSWLFGIDVELMIGGKAQVGDIVSFDREIRNVGVMDVDLAAAARCREHPLGVDVVGIPIRPRFKTVVAVGAFNDQ